MVKKTTTIKLYFAQIVLASLQISAKFFRDIYKHDDVG